ncbi:MAG TPA: hypothetical protein VLW47_13080, partial [Thermodesulfobacteriota bacterium]|nr:hypothetical protein [Thermodesulfobacteriota bacterium]
MVKRVIVITVLMLLSFLPVWIHSGMPQTNVEKIPLNKIWEKNKILDMTYLRTPSGGMLCIAVPYVKKMEGASYTYEKLIFYRETGNSFAKIYEFEPGGGTFLSLHVLYNGELMAIWAGASAYGVFVFSIVENQVRIVIQEGGVKTNPEIVDIDNDGLPELLISSGSKFHPDSHRVDP